ASLKRGVNFGNMLDAPTEGAWALRVEDRYVALVGTREGGHIASVRLPVRWSNHASPDAQARIDPVFMARVDDVVGRLLARGVPAPRPPGRSATTPAAPSPTRAHPGPRRRRPPARAAAPRSNWRTSAARWTRRSGGPPVAARGSSPRRWASAARPRVRPGA